MRFRLVLLIAILLGPILGLVVYNAVEERRQEKEEIQAETLQLVRAVGKQQEAWVEATRQFLVTLSRVDEVRTISPDCNNFLAQLRPAFPIYSNIGVAAPNGTIVCSAVPAAPGVSAAHRSWFQDASRQREFSIGQYQVGLITGRAQVNFGYPVLGWQGEFTGVVYAAVDLTWVNERMVEIDLEPGTVMIILDGNGTVLARQPRVDNVVGGPVPNRDLARVILQQSEGVAEVADIDGTPRIFAFEPLFKKRDGDGVGIYVAVGVDSQRAYAPVDALFVRNLVTLAIAGVFALAMAIVVGGGSVVYHIDQLVAHTKRVSAGDLHSKTDVPYDRGEFGSLARSLDEMTESLRKNLEKEEIYKTLRKKETELGQHLLQIVRLNRELHERNQELDEFAHVVSHDLKAPLRAIANLAEWIEEDQKGQLAEQSLENLRRIRSRAQRLSVMIDGILAYSRAARTDERVEQVDVGKLVREIVELIQPPPGMTIATPDPPLMLYTTPVRLHQVLQNLISNAIKHHDRPSEGHVTIRWTRKGGAIDFQVIDDGPGIPLDAQDRIFKLFETLGATKDSTGIGLAVVKKIIESEGGKIRIESQAGAGATFHFTWPERPGAPA